MYFYWETTPPTKIRVLHVYYTCRLVSIIPHEAEGYSAQGFTCYAIIWSHCDPMVSKFGVKSIILGSPTQNVILPSGIQKNIQAIHICITKNCMFTGFDYHSTINGYTVKTCGTQTFISAKLNCA